MPISAGNGSASARRRYQQRMESCRNFLDYPEKCLTRLDVPEAHYYIYGFASTFSKLTVEQIQKKLPSTENHWPAFLTEAGSFGAVPD